MGILHLRESDEFQVGYSPQRLVAKISICAGIAVYNYTSQIGVLGHFATPEASQRFPEMISWIGANMKPSELEVTLTGVPPDNPEVNTREDAYFVARLNEVKAMRRAYLITAFENLKVDPHRIHRKFSGPDTVTDLRLNMATGKVTIACKNLMELLGNYKSVLAKQYT